MSPVADSTLHSLPLYNFRSRTVPRFLILIRFQKSPLANLILALEFRERLAKYEPTTPIGSSQGMSRASIYFTYES
jgi:hypothetical protein